MIVSPPAPSTPQRERRSIKRARTDHAAPEPCCCPGGGGEGEAGVRPAGAAVYWLPHPRSVEEAETDALYERREEAGRELERALARKARVDRHIEELHAYNEVKDTTQMLLGKLAELKGATTRELYPDFGLDEDD